MTREVPALGDPPDDPRRILASFPRWVLEPSRLIYRAHRRGRSPWWFSSSGGRFDLPEPSGTCYLATTPETALRERLGIRLVQQGAVMDTDAADTVVSTLRVPTRHRLADLRSARATHFGITREISTMVPYPRPQRWAAALAQAGAAGVRYDARLSTAPSAIALGVFGSAGQASWPVDPAPSSGRALAAAAGIAVLSLPARAELPVVAPPPRGGHRPAAARDPGAR